MSARHRQAKAELAVLKARFEDQVKLLTAYDLVLFDIPSSPMVLGLREERARVLRDMGKLGMAIEAWKLPE